MAEILMAFFLGMALGFFVCLIGIHTPLMQSRDHYIRGLEESLKQLGVKDWRSKS